MFGAYIIGDELLVGKREDKHLGYQYGEVKLDHSDRSRVVGAITGRGTVPQVFINGQHIGGLEELERWNKKAA